jgi:Icc-related predicted phosphoesterase
LCGSRFEAHILKDKMRIAIVSDIHGNQTAFAAVLAEFRQTSRDVVLRSR